MAWTETCKIDFKKQIDHKKEQGISVREALKQLSEESEISINTLNNWLYPRERKKKESVVENHHVGTDTANSGNVSNQLKMTPERAKIIENYEAKGQDRTNKPHVAQNTGNNEWYTPKVFVESVRAVMGDIDLDPASSDIANQTVGAKEFYSKENNGLVQTWIGRIFLNPPYAQPAIQDFSNKLCESWKDRSISEAIVLVNNATETLWFQNMAVQALAICFVKTRIRFLDEKGNPSGAPLQGQAILYFGNRFNAFQDHFNQFGVILKSV